MTDELLIFISVQLINVVLSTIKSILTVNGGRLTASTINAISYTFGAIITKMITEQSFEVVITVTLFTNLIGVYVAKWIMDQTKPVYLWTMIATIRSTDKDCIEKAMLRRNIQYTLIKAENDRYQLTIFCYSKGESAMAAELMHDNKFNYTITQSRKWKNKED